MTGNERVEERGATAFLKEVGLEWRNACDAHSPMSTVYEAAAVIREEYDEFLDEVRQRTHDKLRLRQELIQVAAMCLRAVVDLGLQSEQE